MKVAIMQPYLFPYIGYFQLVAAVDCFVILDEVNFIKRGWINRNRILISNKEYTFTLPLKSSSQNKIIRDLNIFNPQYSKEKLLSTVRHAYRKAPEFDGVYKVLEEIILEEEINISKYIENIIREIAKLLDIKTRILFSGDLKYNKKLKGQDKIIDICLTLSASYYINSYGGKSLYNKEDFLQNNINLHFLKPRELNYKQFDAEFVPWLSIIDILMFNPIDNIKGFLNEYDLI